MPQYRLLESSFLGTPLPTDQHIHIIGGGIAGLLTGFYLQQRGTPFTIYEKTDRCGGILDSHKHKYGRSEQAANGFLWCPELQEVCDAIQMPVMGPKETASARYLVRDGALKKMPLGPLEFASAIARATWPRTQTVDTVEAFGQLYLGETMTRQVLEPAFAGIYGADIGKLSFPGALTALAQHMHRSSSFPLAVLKGKRASKKPSTGNRRSGTHSFEGGMGAWVQRLQMHLHDNIQLGVDGLSEIKGDQRIVLAVPAYIASQFFEQDEIKQLLNDVYYTPIITTTFFVRRRDLIKFKDGFGCLLPRAEGLTILGVLFNSSTFEHRVWDDEHISLTCIMRDESPGQKLFSQSDEEIFALVKRELNQLLGLIAAPLERVLYRWPQGIPLYSPALYESWFQLQKLLCQHTPNVNLIGNYTGEISIRRMCQEIRKAIIGEYPTGLLPAPEKSE